MILYLWGTGKPLLSHFVQFKRSSEQHLNLNNNNSIYSEIFNSDFILDTKLSLNWPFSSKLFPVLFFLLLEAETYSVLSILHIPQFSSVQFSHSVESDSLWPHGLQHARLLCLSPTPGACSNLCPLCRWCYPTILSLIIPFSSCLQSFPASGSFQMSQFFTSGGQSMGISDSASVLPMNIQDWFPLGLTGLISLQSMGLSRVFSNITVQKHQFFGAQLSL